MKVLFATLLAFAAAESAHAQLLVTKGSRGTLSVQYEYTAVGAFKDKYDPREWRVKRAISITVPMVAEKQQALSTMRPMEKEQLAQQKEQAAASQRAFQKQAPMMNDMLKIVQECGENEECISRKVAAYGMNTAPSAEQDSVKDDVAIAHQEGALRYQAWNATTQTGTYLIDESYTGQSADPLCMQKPKERCNRQETRKGGGPLPAPAGNKNASIATFEVDSQKKDLFIRLPQPLASLTYTQVVNSDFPEEGSGTKSGVVLDNLFRNLEPTMVTIPAGLSAASGTQTLKFDGKEGESGTLTVKWQFTRQ